ncbi:rRNA-processing arch domain-containing protein [Dichotomocladium elegans]|nr:rRNA-processing arch domain-containing protein [Dichotomocladium elegans]
MFGDDKNIDSIFGVFEGQVDNFDDLEDSLEQDEAEVADEEVVEAQKDQAQPVLMTTSLPTATSAKRSLSGHGIDLTDENDLVHDAKRRLMDDKRYNNPVVADTFEQQTSREVISIAGLQTSSTHTAATAADAAGGGTEGESAQITLNHQVRHQVAIPSNYNYVPISQHIPPKEPARTYPFRLDPFQRVSVSSIERNESVLVSAHTSAGKTVVAEYAIAQSLKQKQRVIYTSPIKALSNQKYREFSEEFKDVGLMTGDVSINPQASCLVMTTEILRSMLYRGSEVMREVAWVVFDEIHYMRDSERGVVWEESIILLPHAVRYVFLSATIPNAMQFAEWVCKIHDQPCHVVYTDFRPTPLQHYMFPAGADGIHLVLDEKGRFKENNFERAIMSIMDGTGSDRPRNGPGRMKNARRNVPGGPGATGGTDGPSDVYRIIKMVMMKNYHPVIVFSFSKRECEANAIQLSKLDFNDDSEREMVSKVFSNAISSLNDDDRQLRQIQQLLPLLRRGIGVHHGGLLPIMKETIEVLFQEGLIKVLFATETFSIGLNMPAKTVVFTSIRKFDGRQTRWVSSGEYIQMSGRAGRRGIDERGVVIMMINEKIEPTVAKQMIKGESDPMNSAFHLSYNMILNLLRVEGISPEYMLERCFYTFQNDNNIPQFERELSEVEAEKSTITIDKEEEIASYYELRKQIAAYAEEMREIINLPKYSLPFMQPGRLVRVKHLDMDFGWGALVNYHRVNPRNDANDANTATPVYILHVLLYCDKDSTLSKDADGKTVGVRPAPDDFNGEPMIVPVTLSSLDGISHIRIVLPKQLKTVQQKTEVHSSICTIQSKFPDDIPVLDPIENMNIRHEGLDKLIARVVVLEEKLLSHPLCNAPELPDLYDSYVQKVNLTTKAKEIKRKLMEARSIVQLEELKRRKRVLRRMGFTSSADVVEMKGRVACEISTGDELLLTEMIFQNVFNDLTVDQTVALLSCFVFDSRPDNSARTTVLELDGPLRLMQETARRIAKVSLDCKMDMDEEEYVKRFNPGLMEVVYAWCQGAKFSHICKMTDEYEGSMIRVFRRLEELLRQMVAAAKSIGNTELENKFSKGIDKLHRDIIFAASLYL